MLGLTRVAPYLRPRKGLRRLTYLLVLALVWGILILPTYLVYRNEIQEKTILPSTPTPPYPQFVDVSARLANVDPVAGTFRVTLDLNPGFNAGNDGDGDLFGKTGGERRLLVPVNFFIVAVSKTFQAGERLGSMDAVLSFDSGSTRGYPFDHHICKVDIFAQVANNSTRPVPMTVTLNGAVPGFALYHRLLVDEGKQYGSVLLDLDLTRSATTRGFSLFVNFLSWCLSLIMGYMALQVARRKRPVEPAMLSPPCALLFALPSLRNVQPGVPGIGATVDVIGFFWNMAIVAVSAIIIILYFIIRWHRPESPTTTAALPPDVRTPLTANTALSAHHAQTRPAMVVT